jgi:hypothetical protein
MITKLNLATLAILAATLFTAPLIASADVADEDGYAALSSSSLGAPVEAHHGHRHHGHHGGHHGGKR